MRLPPELRAHGAQGAESDETQRVSVDSVAEACSPRGGLAPWHQRLVAAYIEEHLPEAIPLATLAGLVGLSRFHFLRAFKQSFGEPPHRYHNIRRVERAKILLRDNTSVTAIGVILGFSETSSFSATFRKYTGLTPTEYRRMNR